MKEDFHLFTLIENAILSWYLDGTTYRSGKIPVLVYDTEEKIYFEK